MLKVADLLQWKGIDKIYSLPWLKYRLKFSTDSDQIKEFVKGCPFTRSRLSMKILRLFHLSNNSIVVSDDDEYAKVLRKQLIGCMPESTQFPEIAKKVIDNTLINYAQNETKKPKKLSSVMIREVYRSLLLNLLGVEILKPLEQYLDKTTFLPSTKLIYVSGLMYAFGLRTPAFVPMREIIEIFYFKGDHHMRKVARKLENLVFNYSIPKKGSWFSTLLELKANGKLSSAQFRGEITSIVVSAYSLSSAIVSALLCLAARPQYIKKIRNDPAFSHCFVKEVLRLYPPFRQFGYEQKGIQDKKQFSEGKTTNLFILAYGLHTNPRFWIKAHEFYPERFLDPATGKGCTFLPFGIGHRDCIGRTYSMNLLTSLIQYACSEESGLELRLPDDFIMDSKGMPIGLIGRLISFPVDDRIYIQTADRGGYVT